MNNVEIILGPPGCGKTHSLLDVVAELLADDVDPTRIAFLAFTRAAAREAKQRAQEKFNFTDKDMPWFRTLHSLAFKQIGARSENILHRNDYKEIAFRAGFDYKGEQPETDEDILSVADADAMFFLENRSRLTGVSLADVWHARNEINLVDHFNLADLEHLRFKLDEYRESEGKKDFTSILTEFVDSHPSPPVDFVIVDEAQDLSLLQWRAVEKIAAEAKRVIIAGDDDQAIYHWAGADAGYFRGLAGDTRILDQSYRVPRLPWVVSQKIIERVANRRKKVFKPREYAGSVEVLPLADHDFNLDASKDSWLFLCRHTHQIRELKKVCRAHGWFYTHKDQSSNRTDSALAVIAWENLRRGKEVTAKHASLAMSYAGEYEVADKLDKMKATDAVDVASLGVEIKEPWTVKLWRVSPEDAAYFIEARRGREPMAAKDPETGVLEPATPRIRLSTVHGAKGLQASGVYLLTDVSESTAQALQTNEDENRVWYVAVTRTLDKLVIQEAEDIGFSYEVPSTA